MIRTIIITLTLGCVIYSCGSPSNVNKIDHYINDFSRIITPNIFDTGISSVGNKIITSEKFLVITNPHYEPFLRIFNKHNYCYLGGFGKRGKGPDEYTEAISFNHAQTINNEDGLWLFDYNFRRLNFLNLKSVVEGKPKIEKRMLIPYEMMPETSIFSIGHDIVIGTSNSSKGDIFSYNSRNEKTKWKRLYPHIEATDPIRLQYILDVKSCLKPDKSMLALCYKHLPRIDIVDVTGDRVLSIDLEEQAAIWDIEVVDDCHKHLKKLKYYDICCTDEMIFALFIDTSLAEFSDGNFSSQIHVFTWEGESIVNYCIPLPVNAFTYDKCQNLCFLHTSDSSAVKAFYLDNEEVSIECHTDDITLAKSQF